MKFTIETTDKDEASMMLKADRMAAFIWQLVHNGTRALPEEIDHEPFTDIINHLLDEYEINIDEIWR